VPTHQFVVRKTCQKRLVGCLTIEQLRVRWIVLDLQGPLLTRHITAIFRRAGPSTTHMGRDAVMPAITHAELCPSLKGVEGFFAR
jgi:hypothetical protein